MVGVQHWIGGLPEATFANLPNEPNTLSIFNYNVLLPNSVDGWWTYKMYLPPLEENYNTINISSWEYRRTLLRNRIEKVNADIVCLQEVSAVSFENDFDFMKDLGYDGKEMFKKGRFRPATFYKRSRFELAVPAIHKDRTLLTVFRPVTTTSTPTTTTMDKQNRKVSNTNDNWYILNCHLQAGKQASRRLRQMNEGVKAVMTTARKLKEKDPERTIKLVVCGDFNGADECGALSFLENGYIDETFYEDGEPITSSRKALPLTSGLVDTMRNAVPDREPPPTLVVPELISILVDDGVAYENPKLSKDIIQRLTNIFQQRASCSDPCRMNATDVEKYLIAINKEYGRGSEFREAARQMGWVAESETDGNGKADDEDVENEKQQQISIPQDGYLSLDGFINIYELELKQGKFWGIAHDLFVLGEPLPNVGIFQGRFDRIYHSISLKPTAIIDFVSSEACPNANEPSDHLPVAAGFAEV